MIKHLYILLIFCSTFGISQEYGIAGITSSLSEINENPTLIKSEFNNLTLTIKKDDKELLSPSYSSSYLYFRDNKIGIIVTNSDIHKEPILLRETKLISNDKKDEKLIYYSKEGDFVTVDYGNNKIIWVADREKIKTSYVFKNLSLASKAEIQECTQIFHFDKQEVSDLSNNSQNLIGLSEEDVIYKYSKFYEKPLLVEQKLGNLTNENDLILLFKGKEDKEFQSVVIFDEHRICKYIMNYYPNDMIKSVSETYDKAFGKPIDFEWIERVGNKKYIYFMDFISAENQFIMHIKVE
ncbi:hypothetical protein [Psychroserpens damuponensis]|uniref:hypothetical protein n=1 Tax=Psychroserpens damuponensis TaxID=943936 RepID=UPI00058E64ED|nr:hypothetical protein [Psychroserpens damuponensis]